MLSGAEDRGVGGTLSWLSGDGDGGSAPDDGAGVVGVGPVSSLMTKSTEGGGVPPPP